MNSRRLLKPLAALLLAVGLVAGGAAPVVSATAAKATHVRPADTGWGFAAGHVGSSTIATKSDTGWGFA